jgi:hypothetical protein
MLNPILTPRVTGKHGVSASRPIHSGTADFKQKRQAFDNAVLIEKRLDFLAVFLPLFAHRTLLDFSECRAGIAAFQQGMQVVVPVRNEVTGSSSTVSLNMRTSDIPGRPW